jgi:outer membrane receptor protein involved in Fe transport
MDASDTGRLKKLGIDWQNSSGKTAPLLVPTRDVSKTQAIFAEFEIPILESLSMQVAARYEDFTDLGLDTTTPKIALRWQPLDSLSLRGSWGESFLAPNASDVGPADRTGCFNNRTGQDPVTGGDLLGVLSCSSKNPNLVPEESNIWNIGFTWEGVENLSISLDYQEIEYTDRIITLSAQDIANQQFFDALAATGFTRDNYDATAGSPSRVAALAYINANPTITITRDPTSNLINEVVRVADNINTNLVDVLDLTVTYNIDYGNWGNFSVALNAAHYLTYEYAGLDGAIVDALGRRNADTALSPPLPETVATLRFGWLKGDHAASFLTKYTDEFTFDGTFSSAFTPRRVIPESYIANASYTYFFDDLFDSSGNATIGINNVFDWEPRRLPVQGGFESRLYDNFGRMFSISLDLQF